MTYGSVKIDSIVGTSKTVSVADIATNTDLASYLTTASAATTYATNTALANYLTTANAATTYATTTDLNSYLTTASAATTYATNTALANYLTTANAATTYATNTALASYLTTTSAATTYATNTALASYLTTANAATTYAPLASPTFAGTVADGNGNVRRLIQNAKTAAYTLVASDTGKHISITTGGVTIPSGVFAAGDIITIFNNSASDQTITAGASTTVRQAGLALTGNRTLGQYGVATVLCVDSNTFVISGSGLS
jgi:hypothetical protein